MDNEYPELDAAMGIEPRYDAHNSAKSGEPTFTFQAGDPYCADITELWAALMSASVADVETSLDGLTKTLNDEISLGNSFGVAQMEKGKVTKSYQYAIDLRDYEAGDSLGAVYDAHETAKTGELTFTLQGGDPYCADLVELWASLMSGNVNEATLRFNQIRQALLKQIGNGNPFGKSQMTKGKVTKAYEHAAELRKIRHSVDKA
ncbi:MAG: hypothetical protein ABJG88_10320 [Litorimonas sp.]